MTAATAHFPTHSAAITASEPVRHRIAVPFRLVGHFIVAMGTLLFLGADFTE